MKSCRENESRISAWLDGEIDAARHLEVLDHFARCPECRRFYLEARALDGLVAGVVGAGEPLPADMWERIASRAGRSRPTRRRLPRPAAWALRVAALLVVALGVGFWALRQAPEPQPPAADRIEVLLEQDEGKMSEARFVELTTEVLRADRRFHRAMLEVMEQVVADTEASPEGRLEGMGDEPLERKSEGKTRRRDVA